MELRGDTGEIWRMINHIYNVRDDVSSQIETDLSDSKSIRTRMLDTCDSEVVRKYAEYIEEQETVLSMKKKAFQLSCKKMTGKLHKFLVYLESVGLELSVPGPGVNFPKESEEDSNHHSKSAIVFRGIEFRETDDFEITEDNLARMDRGNAPVGKDGLYINLHHSVQVEDGPIWEISQSKHKKWHRALHINTNDIPSGINRSAFGLLKKDYWKHRAYLIRHVWKG